MLKTAAESGFSVDWGAFGLVVVTALAAALVIVLFFAIALRLLAAGESGETTGEATPGGPSGAVAPRNPVATTGAVLCIAICVAAVLYGLYLVIPAFH